MTFMSQVIGPVPVKQMPIDLSQVSCPIEYNTDKNEAVRNRLAVFTMAHSEWKS